MAKSQKDAPEINLLQNWMYWISLKGMTNVAFLSEKIDR